MIDAPWLAPFGRGSLILMVERSILGSEKGIRVEVVLHIPKGIEAQLEAAFGHDLAKAALEALAIEGYRTERLSLGQVAELLSVSTAEADQFLQDR